VDQLSQWIATQSSSLCDLTPRIIECVKEAMSGSDITAGQEFLLSSRRRLVQWCDGNEDAVSQLCRAIQEIKTKRNLKKRLQVEEEHDCIRKLRKTYYERTMLGLYDASNKDDNRGR